MNDNIIKVNGESLTPEMRAKVMQAWAEATVSRGKRKGKLKAKCPPMNTLGAACWQGLQTNPFKLGFGHLLMMDQEKREVYRWYDQVRQKIEQAYNDKNK